MRWVLLTVSLTVLAPQALALPGLASRAAHPAPSLLSIAPDRGHPQLRAGPDTAFTDPGGRGFTASRGILGPLALSGCSELGCGPELPGASPLPGGQRERGRTTELALQLLSRAPFHSVAALAGLIAQSPLRIHYAPGRSSDGGGSWGEVSIVLRWRLDADNGLLPPTSR